MPSIKLTPTSPTLNFTESKMHTPDRVLVLKVRDGAPKSSTGLVDKRLFSGENKLHAIMDTNTCLWSLKYDMGAVPPALKQQFTGYSRLLKFVSEYFDRRNIDIVEVKDTRNGSTA